MTASPESQHGAAVANLARRHLDILILECLLNLENREPESFQFDRVQPDAHAVRARAEDCYLSHPRQASQRILQIDNRVVTQEGFVIAIIVRV